jgi:hypothetical protein
MKAKLTIEKAGEPLFASIVDVIDADSFGRACSDAWTNLRQRQMQKETSIGALVEHLDDSVLDQLNGAAIRLHRV